MAKRHKKKAAPKLRDRLPSLRSSSARSAALMALAFMAAAGVVAGWAVAVPRLEEEVTRRSLARQVEVRFVRPPGWAGQELLERLLATARSHLSPDPLRREDLVAVREALMATGWFDAVRQVRRRHTGLVEITAAFATPFGVVREAGGARDHLVDPAGRFLPSVYPAGTSGHPAIVGSFSDLPAVPAEPWAAAEIRAGLDVLRLMRDRPWYEQVTEIRLDREPATGHLVARLRTDRGCTITWGRPPGQEQASEVPARRKLEYLDYHHRHYGHIDRGFLTELDITGDVVIGR